MEYRRLGNTDLMVSAIVQGTMTFGTSNTEAEAATLLDMAQERGVTTIDTAEMYPSPPDHSHYGETERIIGRWLKARGGREHLILASKVAGRSTKGYMRPWGGETRLDRANIETALDQSLSRLQTDYIDLYQLHWPDRKTNIFGRMEYRHDPADDAIALEETLDVLAGLVRAGKIRHIGLSNENPWGLMRAAEWARHHPGVEIASIQNAYSLVSRLFEATLAEICHHENIGLLAYSPLAMGLLTGKYCAGQRPPQARLVKYSYYDRYTAPQALSAAEQYSAIARDHGYAPNQMALAYLRSKPFLAGAIIGATSPEQLRSNIDSVAITLPAEIIKKIEAVHRQFPNPCP